MALRIMDIVSPWSENPGAHQREPANRGKRDPAYLFDGLQGRIFRGAGADPERRAIPRIRRPEAASWRVSPGHLDPAGRLHVGSRGLVLERLPGPGAEPHRHRGDEAGH